MDHVQSCQWNYFFDQKHFCAANEPNGANGEERKKKFEENSKHQYNLKKTVWMNGWVSDEILLPIECVRPPEHDTKNFVRKIHERIFERKTARINTNSNVRLVTWHSINMYIPSINGDNKNKRKMAPPLQSNTQMGADVLCTCFNTYSFH